MLDHYNAYNARIDENTKQQIEYYVDKERDNNLFNTFCILKEQNLEEEKIIYTTVVNWGLDVPYVRELYTKFKRIEYPTRKLGRYLESLNYTYEEACEFIEKKQLREKLKLNRELCELTPQELLKKLD